MSFRTYNALWTVTQDELGGVLERDQELQGTFNQDQRNDVVTRMRRVYAQYIQAARKLDTCHDLILHPQKRMLIRKLLDNTLGRIVEMKHEMASLDLSDIQHMDDVMAELNLTPKDMLVPVPKYVRRERLEIISQRNSFIDDCLRRAGLESVEEDPGGALSVTEAIGIIQRHERARQGRAAADTRREMIARQERERSRGKQQLSKEGAVVRLQSYTRGMLARKQVRDMRHQEELFLGLRPDPSLDRTWDAKLAAARDNRYELQKKRTKEMEAVTERMRTKVVYEDGTALMANMEDKIREWIFVKKHETGKFPDLPDEEEGGSTAILGHMKQEEDELQDQQFLDRKSEREKAREKDKQRKKKEDEDRVICLKSSLFVDDIRGSCDRYQDVWEPRDVESNPKEHPEEDMVEAEQRAIVEYEIRRQVDYLMRQELQKLKEDVEGEKKGSKKKKRMKKGGKKGRKRKEKDLTPDRTTESLFEEMVLNGIIKKIPDVKLADIHGDINLVGTETVELTKFPYPAMGDIKNILTEYVILPLGVEAVHDAAPLVKSVVIGGPRSCGKSVLVQAVAHEAGATLMDLTATNIVGRYPGKSGLNMLMHLVSKVGRLLQPTVILIDAADKMFLKKVPKTDKSDPRRLKKEMPKFLKNIGVEDKIVVIGLTNAPWNCDIKSLGSVYQKMVLMYRPTYGARADLWRHLISKLGGKITPRLDISGLGRITDGFTHGHIVTVVQQVLTEQRISKQDKTPLIAAEFIPALSKLEPIYREEEEALRAWFIKTPLMKKRTKILEEEAEAQQAKGAKGQAKKPPPKKPKKGKKKKKKK